jgi:predicted flap endonuclease-1-like 5' DNA nuclease
MSSKKLQKVFKAFEKRLTTLENRFFDLFEHGIKIIETQINQIINSQEEADELFIAEILSSEEKPKKQKKNKQKAKEATQAPAEEQKEGKPEPKTAKAKAEKIKGAKAETVKAETVKAEVVEVEPVTRRPYTRKADKPAEVVYPMTDLRHIKGIADKLATKLAEFGVHDVHDFMKMSEGLLEQFEENNKGFKKKMETFQWKAQAQAIIDALA